MKTTRSLAVLLGVFAIGAAAAAEPATRLTGTLVVLNKAEASASLIDCATGRELAKLPTGQGPHEVAISPDGKTAVVGDYGHHVTVPS